MALYSSETSLDSHRVRFVLDYRCPEQVLLGRLLESRAKRGTTAAVRALMDLRPETARVLRGDRAACPPDRALSSPVP